jgi:soluble epoxide hydrolase / lipid-phosphate phosphatase
MYGATGPNGEVGFEATRGVYFDNLALLGPNKLLNGEEMEYYVNEYARHGIHGPLNWYRNREVNYMDEWKHFFGSGQNVNAEPRIEQEVLFILATRDSALKPFMAEKMGERIGRLTRREVNANHWALWEKPVEVNDMIGKWLEEKVFGKTRSQVSKL